MTLKRNDKQYIEIEQFADYELTQCVAYELAIRNPKYKKQVDNVVAFYSDNKDEIHRYLNKDYSVDDFDNGIFGVMASSYYTVTEMIYKIEVIPFEEYMEWATEYEDRDRLGAEIYNIVGLLSETFHDHTTVYDRTDSGNLYSTDGGTLFAEKWAIKDGYNIRTSMTMNEENAVIELEDDSKNVETLKEFADLIKSECSDLSTLESGIEIIENFKRPKLKIDNRVARNAEVSLDLNRPLDELLAYITHIKQDIDKNKNVLKAPIELFGEELQKADDISRMCTETKNGKEICFDGRKGITRTQKLADMFFVYDAVKQGTKELRIRTALSEYYETIGKTTDMSDKTFRKYRDIAIDYIENERYKELITGVKQ